VNRKNGLKTQQREAETDQIGPGRVLARPNRLGELMRAREENKPSTKLNPAGTMQPKHKAKWGRNPQTKTRNLLHKN
jgi:hypothetical protein